MSKSDPSIIETFLKDGESMVKMMSDSDKFHEGKLDNVTLFHAEIGMYLIHFEDKKPVGLAHLKPIRDGVDDKTRIIKLEYAVLPDYRRKGIAENLSKMGIVNMARWGIAMKKLFHLVEADILADNTASIKLAEKIGLNLSRHYEAEGDKYLVYMDVIEYE